MNGRHECCEDGVSSQVGKRGDRNGSGDGPNNFFFTFINGVPHPHHTPGFSSVSTFNKVTNALAL